MLEKAGALAALVAGLCGVLFLVVAFGGVLFDDWPGMLEILAGCLLTFLLSLVFGYLALAAGAVTGRRGLSIGVAAGVTVATYVIQGIAPLVNGLEWAERLSPFFYFLDGDPLLNGLPIGYTAVLGGLAGFFLAVAVWGFGRRDVGVA